MVHHHHYQAVTLFREWRDALFLSFCYPPLSSPLLSTPLSAACSQTAKTRFDILKGIFVDEWYCKRNANNYQSDRGMSDRKLSKEILTWVAWICISL